MGLKQLEIAINRKRNEMIKNGMSKGLLDQDTILFSQELDLLLNDYNRLLIYLS